MLRKCTHLQTNIFPHNEMWQCGAQPEYTFMKMSQKCYKTQTMKLRSYMEIKLLLLGSLNTCCCANFHCQNMSHSQDVFWAQPAYCSQNVLSILLHALFSIWKLKPPFQPFSHIMNGKTGSEKLGQIFQKQQWESVQLKSNKRVLLTYTLSVCNKHCQKTCTSALQNFLSEKNYVKQFWTRGVVNYLSYFYALATLWFIFNRCVNSRWRDTVHVKTLTWLCTFHVPVKHLYL